MRTFAIATAFLCTLAGQVPAATYYLDADDGNDSSGNGNADAPWASMKRAFKAVEPGDTVLLRPGNYGNVTFGENKGVGSEEGVITYKADPETTTPRAETWYEQKLDRPDPANPEGKVVFTGIKFDLYSNDKDAKTKTGTPVGHYVKLEGLNVVGGSIEMASYVSEVVIRDCNVFGNWGRQNSEVTNYGLKLYRRYYWGSNYQNILIERCYVSDVSRPLMLVGEFHNLTVRDSHFRHFSGSAMSLRGKMDDVLLEGNHVHGQVPVASQKKHTSKVSEVSENSPKRVFTITDDVRYHDWAVVSTSYDDGTELRKVAAYDDDARQLTLAQPLSSAPKPGAKVELWDGSHGSGVSVRTGGFTLRGNRIHDLGTTRGMYLYKPHDSGYANIVMENNLFYSTKNQYTVDLNKGLGDHTVIRNNTFVGRVHRNYRTSNYGNLLYGFGMVRAKAAPNADASTIVVANNLIVGRGSAPDSATVRGNIVYASGDFDEDNQGPNQNNHVYYDGEDSPQAPRPFHGSGNFFVGGDKFEKFAFKKQHGKCFNAFFHLVKSASAVDAADPEHATETDITGQPRDDQPDVGAYEWRPDAASDSDSTR